MMALGKVAGKSIWKAKKNFKEVLRKMKNSLIKTFGSDYKNHLEIISVKHNFRKMYWDLTLLTLSVLHLCQFSQTQHCSKYTLHPTLPILNRKLLIQRSDSNTIEKDMN